METKKCTICKKDLPKTTEYFATRLDKKSLTYQSSCRNCHKEYRKKHYQANKDKYIKKANIYNKSIIDWFLKLKKSLKCKCGEDRWWVLDFHHRDPLTKEYNISSLIRKGSKKNILKEIEKCDVLCSNCHRDLHYQEKQASNA